MCCSGLGQDHGRHDKVKVLEHAKYTLMNKECSGGRHSVCASYPAVPGLILGVPEATYLMLPSFIESGTAEREKA